VRAEDGQVFGLLPEIVIEIPFDPAPKQFERNVVSRLDENVPLRTR
jgi:hypothetical protein